MTGSGAAQHDELLALGRILRDSGYQFTAVTPDTHQGFLERAPGWAHGVRDVLGWSMRFERSTLEPRLFELMLAANICEPAAQGSFRASLRCSTLGDMLFFHSSFPTHQTDAVFFGPDSYRFARAILARIADPQEVVVDVGCGSGVGGIALARSGKVGTLVLADVNPRALALAAVNAQLNDVRAELVLSDVLGNVAYTPSLVIANPPYLADLEGRVYRSGGGELGTALSLRIAAEAAARFAAHGGRLLLYSGAPVLRGEDRLRAGLLPVLCQPSVRFDYEELDPDVFGSELSKACYAGVERIAAALLDASFGVGREPIR